jgi:RimJ/RimL family protein N-acetyltransferase
MADAVAIFDGYARDPDTVRYLAWRPHASLDETRQFLARSAADWGRGAAFAYAICRPDTAQPFGMIEIERHPERFRANFGYVISRAYWGQGYAAEALSRLVEWALTQPGIWRAAAFCDIENRASARVMEKAGMAFEGVLRRWSLHPNVSPKPRDCLSYAKVR